MVLSCVPQVTGIARNQAVSSKTMKTKNVFHCGKVIFCCDPKKLQLFFSIKADVLSKMSLNSVYFFLFIGSISSRGFMVSEC